MLISIKHIFSQKVQNEKKKLKKEYFSQHNIITVEILTHTIKLLQQASNNHNLFNFIKIPYHQN